MEGTSVLSPSWWEKRRAWARQSRSWRPTAPDEDEVAPATHDVPELPPPHLDDVFLEGSPSRQIETWLQECGSSVEVPPEEPGSPGPLGCGDNGTSFEDDLTLGAEALLLPGTHKATGRPPRDRHPSVASSGLSSLTTKTSCSVAAVLARRQEDAEEILAGLGFALSEPGAVGRIPPRFLAAPSRARGIDTGVFLRAQVRRLQTEEPGLALAGRFQQAQALAVTADTFFCLYSYVSRTPVRCICPPRPAWACHHVTSVSPPGQPATLSPIERLKSVVSTMSLYVPPRNGGGPGDGDNLRDGDNAGWVAPVSPALGKGTWDKRDPMGWGGDGNMGTARPPWGATRCPQGPLSPCPVWGVPVCPHHCGGEGERAMSPSPMGVTGDAPCPLGAGRDVTLSPAPGPPAPHTKDPQDSMGTRSPSPDTPRTGGHRGGPSKVPVSPCPHWQEQGDSFELEELLSASEDDDDDNDNKGDTCEESARSLCPSITTRRSFMLHGSSGRSDSSGFVEEPLWGHPPARLCDTHWTA